MSHHSLVALHWEGDQLVPETELPYETVNYDTEVTILHTNDFHSCIDSFADGAGGLARIATTVRRAQANGPTLMVDAGDSVFGSPTLWSTQGAGSTARLRGAAGYHLAALGNHDLEHGAPGVRELLEGGYRLVASNLEFADADLAKQIAPAYMTSVDGLRIGFTGVTTLDTLALVPRRVLDGVQFIDPYESTVRTVKALEPLVDVVVVLSHLGFDSDELLELMPEGQAPVMMLQNDRGLVGRLKGSKVAAILGGHSHAALAPTPVMAGDRGMQRRRVRTPSRRAEAPTRRRRDCRSTPFADRPGRGRAGRGRADGGPRARAAVVRCLGGAECGADAAGQRDH
jgi:2',3'-cyclic-nucleotide 2'-phosphodiesterase (5'-nucleotidase family)